MPPPKNAMVDNIYPSNLPQNDRQYRSRPRVLLKISFKLSFHVDRKNRCWG